MITQRTLAIAFAFAFGLSATMAGAQGYPDRTVKIIVPTTPGGAIDITARVVAEKMQAKWGPFGYWWPLPSSRSLCDLTVA